MVEDHREPGAIVEQRVEFLVEQRQPVLHAGEALALADRGIERIRAQRRAEALDVIAAEPADRLLAQRDLGDRRQLEALELTDGALAGRIEGADRLQRVAEEVETHRLFLAGRKQVEDTAAHGEFAAFAHGRHPLEAAPLQGADDVLHGDAMARLGGNHLLGQHIRRRHLLQQRVGRRQDQRPVRRQAQRIDRRHRRQPPRRRVARRADAVIGQAVPGRQGQNRQIGRNEAQRVFQRGDPVAVAHDEDHRRLAAAQAHDVGEQERLVAVDDVADLDTGTLLDRLLQRRRQAHG